MNIQYDPKLKPRARELRKQGVLSEVLLWAHLKGRKMRCYQFMRQKPVGEYINFVMAIEGWIAQGKDTTPSAPFFKGE